MNARLELHHGINLVALNLEFDLLVAARVRGRGVQHLDLPFLGRAETIVHLEQVAREDSGFIATCRSANLNDNVFFICRIARNKHELDVFLDSGKALFNRGDFLLREFLHVRIGKHELCFFQIIARADVIGSALRQGALRGIFFRQAIVFFLIGQNVRVAHLGLKVLEGRNYLLKLIAHGYLP